MAQTADQRADKNDSSNEAELPRSSDSDISFPDAFDSGRRPGVLLIEDEPQMLRALEYRLRKRGFVVWTALEGKEALELYQRYDTQIDLVLSDVHMPGMDGPEAFAQLRKQHALIRFCFMTSDIRRSTAKRLLSSGALRVFPKPFPSVAGVAEELWTLVHQPEDFASVGLEAETPTAQFVEDAMAPSPEATANRKPVGFFQRVLCPLLRSVSGSRRLE